MGLSLGGCRRAGVFVSSWLGGLLLTVGEWIIKKLPLVKHIYSAAKQARHGAGQSGGMSCTCMQTGPTPLWRR